MAKSHRISNSLKGALVADAASLGTHWIYDVDRVAKIAKMHGGSLAFVPVDEKNYEHTKGYFAHPNRPAGTNTQYGEVLRTAIASILKNSGKFDVENYQGDFAAHFGPGGTYIGYIDYATRGTLANIAAGDITPSGTDDTQLPALAALPAVIAADPHSVEGAVRVTNNNDYSVNAGRVFAHLLNATLNGAELYNALDEAASIGDEEFSNLLKSALSSEETDSVAYGQITGRACNLVMSVPLCFHILKNTKSFENAIEVNSLAAGDNAGRSIVLGAIAGAYYGFNNGKGIPEKWVAKLADAHEIFEDCDTLGARVSAHAKKTII